MLDIPPPRATRDFLPEEAAARRRLLASFAHTAESYGYQPIETPSFERVELFSARSGAEIKGSLLTLHLDHEEYALRPELTAPICRVLAAGALADCPKPYRLYYSGSCFRYVRPQSGGAREFTQAGVELVGEGGPRADAEVIAVACRFLRSVGLNEYSLRLGTVGVARALLPEGLHPEDRALVLGHLDRLTAVREACQKLQSEDDRLLLDELRIDRREFASLQERAGYEGEHAIAARPDLDAAEMVRRLPQEAEAAVRSVWQVEDMVSDDVAEKLLAVTGIRGSREQSLDQARLLLEGSAALEALEDFAEVCRQVEAFGQTDFEVTLGIARGLTFYTATVFEIGRAGGRKYCGGGRYDGVLEIFGGEPLPSTGCAFRLDALEQAVRAAGVWEPSKPFQVFLIARNDDEVRRALPVAEALRDRGFRVGVGAAAPADSAEEIGRVEEGGVICLEDGRTLSIEPA